MSSPLSPGPEVPCLDAWLRSGGRKTLGSLKAEIKAALGVFEGTPGADDPFALQNVIVDAQTELCQRTHCLHTSLVTNIVGGQAVYCSDVILIQRTGLLVKDPSGYWIQVPVFSGEGEARIKSGTSVWQDYQHDWQFAASATVSGPITLYPTPKTDRPGALWVSGYFAPSEFWEIDPVTFEPLPLDDSHESPLPGYAIPALRALCVFKYADYLSLLRPELEKRLTRLERSANQLIGTVESEAHQMNESLRRTSRGMGRGLGYAGGRW
jgi:hypothetical protein